MRGREFYDRNLYDEAIICFKRSKNDQELRRSQAMKTYITAESLKAQKRAEKDYVGLYLTAASDFESLGELLQAAECFLKGNAPKTAANLYFKIGHYFKALNVCVKHQLQAEALNFLNHKPQDADYLEVERFARVFALISRRANNKRDIMKFLNFVNLPGARSFLIRYNEVVFNLILVGTAIRV